MWNRVPVQNDIFTFYFYFTEKPTFNLIFLFHHLWLPWPWMVLVVPQLLLPYLHEILLVLFFWPKNTPSSILEISTQGQGIWCINCQNFWWVIVQWKYRDRVKEFSKLLSHSPTQKKLSPRGMMLIRAALVKSQW